MGALDDIHFVNIDTSSEPSRTSGGSVLFVKNEPVETKSGKVRGLASDNFSIPQLPTGRMLVFNILSTWGDPYYVGLMGLEIFDRHGHLVVLNNIEKQLWAEPADINVLSEYGKWL